MKEYMAFDSHKHYTLAEREDVATCRTRQVRINHQRGAITQFLSVCERGTTVAVEATANWYWIVDEIERAGLCPALVHPRKAKLMMGMINKTDKLDVHGLNRLQRNEVLPTVWIPPGGLRDLRELTRTRITVSHHRTRLKNRIQATLSKYGLGVKKYSDPYGKRARELLNAQVGLLPTQARYVTQLLLNQLDFVIAQVAEMESRLKDLVEITPEMKLLRTLPGVGVILSSPILLEIGDIRRFPSAEHLAAYAGTTPRVHASGDKVRYGRLRPDVNRYLRWGFVEAANSVVVNHTRQPDRHVSILYHRIRCRRNHAKAVGAVARHLAEATFHVLSEKESYRDPGLKQGRTREA